MTAAAIAAAANYCTHTIECYRSADAAAATAAASAGGLREHSENRCARVGRFLTLRHSVCMCLCVYKDVSNDYTKRSVDGANVQRFAPDSGR
jgi:heterodisulfide reductase subunit A-like polyferredoxin